MESPNTRRTKPLVSRELTRVDRTTGRLLVRKYRLTVTAGPASGKSVALVHPLVLGSGADVGFVLDDPTVSRLHVQLTPRADGVLVKDLDSMNGTFVSGARLEQALIESDATLMLGATMVRIAIVDDDLGMPLAPSSWARPSPPAIRCGGCWACLARLAPSDASVVLLGETGTGKDVLAHALHAASSRASKPLVVFDCSAVSANLIESELFGHGKGAFTGAVAERKGAFVQAHGGTLFLDEIGELPLELQPRLLRAVESGTIKPVGADKPVSVDVRLVCATHRDLEASVRAGTFRQDLYYRLAVALVRVPPLRERVADIPLLARRFLSELQKDELELPRALMDKMIAYSWPGNVRELRNVVARAVLGDENALKQAEGRPRAHHDATSLDVPFKEAKERLVDSFTRDYIEALLRRHNGNVSRAARSAGLARPYLHKLAVKYGLKQESEPGDE